MSGDSLLYCFPKHYETIGASASKKHFADLARLATTATWRKRCSSHSYMTRDDGLEFVEGLNMATFDWSQCPVVESVPGKISGAWVLKGTRMPVSAIFENVEAGASIDDIMEWFDGLDRDQVRAVIEFAVRSLDETSG